MFQAAQAKRERGTAIWATLCGATVTLAALLLGHCVQAAPATGRRFDAVRAMHHVRQLSVNIGPRPAGTEAEGRAIEYVSGLLAKLGYRTRVQEVPLWSGLTSANVIADQGSGDAIVIGAHLDSVATSPGANDNASGVATLIELARYFAGEKTGCCLRFIAFGTEEGRYKGGRSVKGTGRAGSWHYVKSLSKEELGRIRLMINMDMIGAGERLEIGDLTDGGGQPARACTRIGRDLNIYCAVSKFGGKSDYRPFSDMGLPIVAFAWGTHPSHHTSADTAEIVDSNRMSSVFWIIVRYLERHVLPAGT